ncbi:hypothetical protein AURDEDRAFT_168031 [Auricularia subglabra TFB-10046 SS5]|nr:hypothetical protein AURDEDRAFT_168031 [Auricularia subglabra TFB-10046 SS5]
MQTELQLTPLWSERQQDNVVGARISMLRGCSSFLTVELLPRLHLQPQTPWWRDESMQSAVEGMPGWQDASDIPLAVLSRFWESVDEACVLESGRYPPGWVVVPNQSYIDWSILCAALCEKDAMIEQYGAFNGEGYGDFLASRADFSLRGEHVRAPDLDATDEEYAEVLEAAGGLADETYPRTQHFTKEAISVVNVDIAHVMTARALSRYGDANPDPCLPVPSRQALVVVRRSLRLAGRPAEVAAPPAATKRRVRPLNEDAEEPPRKRCRKGRAERPAEAMATPPRFCYSTVVVVPLDRAAEAREACADGGQGIDGGVAKDDAAGASDGAAGFRADRATESSGAAGEDCTAPGPRSEGVAARPSPVGGGRSSRAGLASGSRAAGGRGDGATSIEGLERHERLLHDELGARESGPAGGAAGAAMNWALGVEAAVMQPAGEAPVRRKSRSKRRKNGPRGSQQKSAAQGGLQESPEPELEPEYEYHVASFTEDDTSCKPTPQPAYAPPPPAPPRIELPQAGASRPTHHSPSYRVRRVQEYRSLLPLEVIQPAVVLDASDRPLLEVECLNRTAPGWRGFIPRLRISSVRKEWGTPGLKEIIDELKIVPYAGLNTAISDMSGRTVFYRTTPFREHSGEDVVEAFAADSYRFAAACPIKAGDRRHNPRGQHYACIMGVHRQYAKEAYYTRFHREYKEEIDWYFRENGPAWRITRYLTAIIDTRFPAVSERMRRNHAWHYEHTLASGSPLEPQFGLFWNYCINLPSPEAGVPRVFTYPHTDCMNCAVLLCAVFVFWQKGWVGEDEWSFLVVWELGVIVECPRGCFLLCPSALLFHFNARVVKCKRGESPTPSNTQELPKTAGFPIGGRGSGVWFTQASMHSHTSERDSKGRLPDYEALARQCFPDMRPVAWDVAEAPFLSEL